MPARYLISGLGISAAILTAVTTSANALDWKLSTSLSEKIDFDDNIQMDPESGVAAIGSTTSASLKATTKNKVGEFVLDAKYGYSIFRGIDGDYNSKNVDNAAGMSFTKNLKTTTFEIDARVAQVSTFFSEAEDTTITNTDTNNITYSTNVRLNEKLNETDTLNFSTYFKRSTFDAVTPGLNANDSYGVSTKFSRKVNRTLSGGISGAVDIFDSGGGGSTRYTVTGNLEKQLTNRLSIKGKLGVRFIIPANRNLLANNVASTNGKDVVIGYPFDASLDYRGKTYTASTGINSSVSASSSGFLQKNSTFFVSARHTVNEYLSYGINSNYTITESADSSGAISERTSVSISPTLSYSLTRDWSVDLGYQFRFRDTGATTADSNKVFLTLSNNTVLLP